jgi:hypothetical protein
VNDRARDDAPAVRGKIGGMRSLLSSVRRWSFAGPTPGHTPRQA